MVFTARFGKYMIECIGLSVYPLIPRVCTTVVCHGSPKCSSKFSSGLFPVKLCCTRKPKNANIANLPAAFSTDSQSQPEIETLETEKKMILLKQKGIVEGPRIEI